MTHRPLPEYHSDGAQRWRASGPHGDILLSEIQENDYSVWHIDFLLQSDVTLTMRKTSPGSSVALAFILKRNVSYAIDGFRTGVAKRNHYNLTFLPESHCELMLKKGDYELFGIEFKPEYLMMLSSDEAPLFRDFISAVAQGRATSIVQSHKMATTEIMDVVSDLAHFRQQDVMMKRLYIRSRVMELLRLAVENIAAEASLHQEVPASEMKAMNDVREYLLANLNNPGSLSDIALHTGINEFKLKNGFRKMFGKSVIAFVLEERLIRAKAMITNTNVPIKVIATRSGYRNISNFTTAFRKHFGYPPGKLKRGNSNDDTSGSLA